MEIEPADLERAAQAQIVTPGQASALWAFLSTRPGPTSADSGARFSGVNVAYYFGALLVIAAMGWLMTLGFEAMGGFALFALAALYAVLFSLAARTLLAREQTRIPGGLLATMAVCMTPLAVYGLERGTGYWANGDPGSYRGFFPYLSVSWFFMEASTVVAGLFALRKVRFPFLVAPIAFVLWFMSMDIVSLLGGSGYTVELAQRVSIGFGLGMLCVAYLIDQRTRDDFAFWLYLFGLVAFWGGLTSLQSDSELNKLLYCALNLFLIVLGSLLLRRVFLVFGGIGVNAWLVHLSYKVFKGSMMFPFVLTLLGLAIIAVAVQYQKHHLAIAARIESWVPSWLRELLPVARSHG